MHWLEKYKDYQLFLFGVCFLLGIVLSSMIVTNGIITFKRMAGETITVTGAASEDLESDFVKWQPIISRYATSMADAYQGLEQDRTVVLAYLAEKGLKKSEIKIQPVRMETIYVRAANGAYTNTVDGFTFRQNIGVESADVAKIEQLANDSVELVNRGITFEPVTPEYFYTKLDDIKVSMLEKATQNAKQRAMAMAKSSGNRVGSMRSSQMGVFQITPRYSTEVADYGINDTTTRDKKVTAVVNVTFALK